MTARLFQASAAVLVMVFGAMPLSVTGHEMAQVEANLTKNERYAQLGREPAPAFSLHDTAGNAVALTDFRGKVVVLNFLYARCHDTCPLHSALIARIQALVSEVDGLDQQIQFVTIATDTEDAGDTKALMAAHGETYGLTPRNWTFLYGGAGREQAGIALAKTYGLEFVPTGHGTQMHGVITYLIDPEGVIRARFHGLEFQPIQLMLYAAALAHGEHSPMFNANDVVPQSIASRLAWSAGAALVAMTLYGAWLRRRSKRLLAPGKETSSS